ncbi:MAG: DUF4097 family beta strand repeat-containing protein [Lachnospiraceae bacterium]|nr:DUF4097 family beta strand repeat-containing protein [Lachnospiraceae bacterium]
MNKKEYMEQISRALECVDPDTARDIMEDYEAHFERAAESGRSEQEIIGELGSIEEFVEELKQFTTGKESKADGRTADGSGSDRSGEAADSRSDQSGDAADRKFDGTGGAADSKFGQNSDMTDGKSDQSGDTTDRKSNRTGDTADSKFGGFGENADEKFNRFNENSKSRFDQRISDIVNSAVNAATSQLSHVSEYLDKAFDGMGEWFSNFEKTGESEKDYRKRQEKAKYDQQSRWDRSEGGERVFVYDDHGYQYSADTEEEYMDECSGILTKQEGIRHISVDSKAAEVTILRAEDDVFHYSYKNDGSAGSKVVYRLEKRVSQDTIYLNIARDEQVQKKNHFTILGGIFEENADIRLVLRLPEWMETLSVAGKSGDITMSSCGIRTLQLKTMSGDVAVNNSSSDKCMLESISGDATAKNSSFGYVLLSSKSGDAGLTNSSAQKAACRSMSGDATATNCELGEAAVSSMSGDAKAVDCHGGAISVESKSGDAGIRQVSMRNIKVSSISGDADTENAAAEKFIIKTVSGDVDAKQVRADILKASATSGDISLRGSSADMALSNGSGDIIIVQEGNTRATVTTRSGDVHFHLRNNGEGFAAKVSTHGDITCRYGNLQLVEAENGLHRYGAEGSSLEISLTSGDITITD